MKEKNKELPISELLKERSLLKQDVYQVTRAVFADFKIALESTAVQLKKEMDNDKVRSKYEDKGGFESHIYVGSDVLVFHMHTNVFCFPEESAVRKTSYVKEDKDRAYCGVINVYNFLADSFLHGRLNDTGYLLARIFVNKDRHFFVEGKGRLGFLYKDFINGEISEEKVKEIIETSIRHAAEFDLLTPPYEIVNQVNVMQIQAQRSEQRMKTGKRLGFQFSKRTEDIK
jgi:hypothetical protein